MISEGVIKIFNEIVMSHIKEGNCDPESIRIELIARIGLSDEVDELLLRLSEALSPTDYVNERVRSANALFRQCYALMSLILDADVIDPVETFTHDLEQSAKSSAESQLVMMGRYWQANGYQEYDQEGNLSYFQYNPMTLTRHIAAVISGDYFAPDQYTAEAIGAIGQLATHPSQQGRGHGRFLADAFTNQVASIADNLGHTLSLLVVESEADAQGFWSKMGFKTVVGSHYMQPPLAYDASTGQALSSPSEEILMVKFINQPNATSISKHQLLGAVQTIYENWYIPDELDEDITHHIRKQVFDGYYAEFVKSLPIGDRVMLS